MDKNVKNNSGVSIIEILVSMVIVSMLLIAIVAVFPRMMQHRKGIHEADQARMVAAEVLEGLQLLTANPAGYSCSNGFFGNAVTTTSGSAIYEELLNPEGEPRTIGAVTYIVDDPEPELVCGSAGVINTITVTVSWEKSGKKHQVKVVGASR